MTYAISTLAGAPPITDHSTTQKVALGTIVRASDPLYGEAEFIYLLGVASTAAGTPVTYNLSTFATTLAAVGTGIPQPVAVAMAATVALEYGWYQISGLAAGLKNITVSLVPGAAVGIATIGYFNATATAIEVQGIVVANTAVALTNAISVMMDRPHMQGRGTT